VAYCVVKDYSREMLPRMAHVDTKLTDEGDLAAIVKEYQSCVGCYNKEISAEL